MKERPILFSAPMVRAVLDGHKTQTRRILKPPRGYTWHDIDAGTMVSSGGDKLHYSSLSSPYGQPGDRLWVKETWRTDKSLDKIPPSKFCGWPVRYEADGTVLRHGALYGDADGKTRPSIFMPFWACRIFLEVTAVRVERLQGISEEDAIAEGVQSVKNSWHWIGADGLTPRESAVDAYRDLWSSINGHDSWDVNPWVRTVEFREVTP